ncbi:MAG: hypothetical protein ACI9RP_000957 [Cyclobacteriaceae bacterium]|jgi:hypothetical protein
MIDQESYGASEESVAMDFKSMMCKEEQCDFKKCCKKYKKNGRHCKKCPKL